MSAIAMSINFLILTAGSIFFWPRCIGTCINLLLGLSHAYGIYLMYLGWSNPFSRLCAMNVSTSAYDGDYRWNFEGRSYADDHIALMYLVIL